MNPASKESSEQATGPEPTADEPDLHPATQEIPDSKPRSGTDPDTSGGRRLGILVENALERCRGILFKDLPRRGLSTGFKELDDLSNGLEPGRVYVIAARPSMGKTSMLLQILGEVCLNQHIPSLLFTGDLAIPQVIDRLIFKRALISQWHFYDPEYAPCKGDLQRLQKSAQELAVSGLVLEEGRDLTIEAIAARAREERAKTGIGLIVIDHLHCIRSESTQPGTSRKHEMTGVIRSLRNLARELELPVLVSAQLKRRAEGRLPRIGDIRESGAIEHEADFIGLLHKERQIECGFDLLISKNNNGPLGSIGYLFVGDIQRFEEGLMIPGLPDVSDLSDEEQQIARAWRDYQNEKDFPREMA